MEGGEEGREEEGGEEEEEEEGKEVEVEEGREVSPLPLSPSQSSLAGAGEEVGEVKEGPASLELDSGVGAPPPAEPDPVAALQAPPWRPEEEQAPPSPLPPPPT